jgi:phosphate transport system substrate-binding protein
MLSEKKAQLAFVGRELLKDESEALNRKPDHPVETVPVAIQGVGLVVNSRNLLRAISMEQIESILRGRQRTWDPIGPKLGPIRVVIGRPNTSTYLLLRQLGLFDSLRCAYQFVDGPDAVDSVCAAHPNALGFQPLAYLPKTDKGMVRNLDIFTVLKDDTAKIPVAISSHPANIVREYYPLRSKVYAVRVDEGINLASGVVSFFTSAVGQKLLLNHGFVPATMPVRLIQFGQSIGE